MTTARPHMLYVAWGFPPCRGGGVYRALATANRFAALGWRVTVLTADEDTFHRFTGADLTLLERVDPGVEVVRVPFDWPILEADLRRWPKARAKNPQVWAKWRTKRDHVPFPETGYGPWRPVIEKAAERIHAAGKVDLTVATANPHVAFTAAYHLNRKHGVPYVMDYRDAWLLDVFTGDRLHEPNSRAARWEKKLVESAQEVWFVNDPIKDWHEKVYPAHANKMHTVANGFDPDLVPDTNDRGAVPADRPLTFGYVGTVSPKVPLTEFVDGWKLAVEQNEELAGAKAKIHGYLGYYAQPRADMLLTITNAAEAGVSYEGPVGKAEIAKAYDAFDVQLLMLGKGRYVTSGKVFEYLATGLPIVSVHDPENAASDVLQGHPLWFPVTEVTPEAIASALVEAARAARTADEGVRAKAREFGAQYRRDLQLDPRIEALAAAVKGVKA